MNTEKLDNIKLLLLDVDGVLTDGSIVYDDLGNQIKAFNAKDGFGIRMLAESGTQIGIVTGRFSKALVHRCRDLGIKHIWQGVKDKEVALKEILETLCVSTDEIAYIGDDLPDLPIMRKVGLAIAVADAHPELKTVSHLITKSRGGRGAVREICEALLKAKNQYNEMILRFV
jgi:3-deoxy-D-manno-octulosonate 8-phosphate phosphatase (KDO 8-P phosphatase)